MVAAHQGGEPQGRVTGGKAESPVTHYPMTEANATVCPKCGHVRTVADVAPAWQCPACGIAYSKFKDASGRHRGDEGAAPGAEDLRARTLSVGQSDRAGGTAVAVYLGLLFLVLVLIFTFHGFLALRWAPAAFAASAFLFWLGAYRRLRLVIDVPASTIAAAGDMRRARRGRHWRRMPPAPTSARGIHGT